MARKETAGTYVYKGRAAKRLQRLIREMTLYRASENRELAKFAADKIGFPMVCIQSLQNPLLVAFNDVLARLQLGATLKITGGIPPVIG